MWLGLAPAYVTRSPRSSAWERGWLSRLPSTPLLDPAIGRVGRIVAHLPDPAVVQEELLLLGEAQGTGADPAEDGDLVAALIDGAVAVGAPRDRQGMAAEGDRVVRD